MDLTARIALLVGLVLVAVLIQWARTRLEGRTRRAAQGSGAAVDVLDVAVPLGEQATLLQFSTTFCAPCRATSAVLRDVAEQRPGVAHIEVNSEERLDLVRRFDIVRAPTVVILDSSGQEAARTWGVPKPEAILTELDQLAPAKPARPGPRA